MLSKVTAVFMILFFIIGLIAFVTGLPYWLFLVISVGIKKVVLILCLVIILVILIASQVLDGVGQEVAPEKPADLYDGLSYSFTQFYGRRGKEVLEDKIKSLMKQGLSREEAIYRIAEKERLIEKE